MKKNTLLFISILTLIIPNVVNATMDVETIEKGKSINKSGSSDIKACASDKTDIATTEVVNNACKVTGVSKGSAKITVTYENNDTDDFNVTVTEPEATPSPSPSASPSPSPSPSPEAKEIPLTLESVNIPGAKLTTAFNKDTKEYDVEITDKDKFDLTKVYVTYTYKNNDKAVGHITSKLDNKNTFRIVVQNQKDKSKTLTYTFKVKEEAANANLSKLEIVGYTFNEAFNKDTTSYTVTIPHDITTVTVNATPEDSNSKVSPGISFTKDNLEVGNSTKNTVTIKVTNGNETKTYKIFITRSEEEKLAEKATSIISSKITSNDSDFDIPETTSPDSILDYIIITLGSLVLFSIGAIGIYFYIKTSPKKMKKELLKEKEKKEESPIVETKTEPVKKQVPEKPKKEEKKPEIEEL